jgi:hypothetical protein
MATANFNINAEDGWVAVTPAGVDFVRIRSNTPKHAFYVTDAASTPDFEQSGGAYATGTITFAGQPTDTDTITVGADTFNFLDTVVNPATDVEIGADAEETLDNLLAIILAQTPNVVPTKNSATVIGLRAATAGTAGNSIPLTEAATNVTVSGAGTLAGGTALVPGVIGYKQQCDEGFWCDVPVTTAFYVRVAENLPQDTRIDVFYVAS